MVRDFVNALRLCLNRRVVTCSEVCRDAHRKVFVKIFMNLTKDAADFTYRSSESNLVGPLQIFLDRISSDHRRGDTWPVHDTR